MARAGARRPRTPAASARRWPSSSSASAAREHEAEPLSAREQDVLRLLADGATKPEIAAQLLVAESTMKKYLSTIYQKLGVARRPQAILVAQAREPRSSRAP